MELKKIVSRFFAIAAIFYVGMSAIGQQLVVNDGLKTPYVEEAILPVSNSAYVVVKDSTVYLYNATAILPSKKQELTDSYILNTVDNKLYDVRLVPQYLDRIDEDLQQIITLVTYKYEVQYGIVDQTKANELVKLYGHLIPKIAISETFSFNETLDIEDTYSFSIHQDKHFALPSHFIRIDKNNALAVHQNGNLVLSEVKNHKTSRKQTWTGFNGDLNLLKCVKIGNVVRLNFQLYQQEIDSVEDFWSIIDLENQGFVAIDLKEFHSNLEKLNLQDVALLNRTPYFYKAQNGSNIKLFVFPKNNFVWYDDKSHYFGSDDLSEYVTMQMNDKNYNVRAHDYIYNHPSQILKAITPEEKEKIKLLEKKYVINKRKTLSERCKK